MSYDLTIWKGSAIANRAMTKEVLAAIADDAAHPAMQRFDTQAFVHDLQAEFGGEAQWSDDATDPPFLVDVADFTGASANWIGANIGFSKIAKVLPKLFKVVAPHGLVIFDWQTGELHADQ